MTAVTVIWNGHLGHLGHLGVPRFEAEKSFVWHARGFWGATFPIPPVGKEALPSLHGNMQGPDPVELFGAASVFFLIREKSDEWIPEREPSRRRRSTTLAAFGKRYGR
jgi:hypothetical protein